MHIVSNVLDPGNDCDIKKRSVDSSGIEFSQKNLLDQLSNLKSALLQSESERCRLLAEIDEITAANLELLQICRISRCRVML